MRRTVLTAISALTLLCNLSLFAAGGDRDFGEKQDDNKDIEALRRWLRDKRLVSVKEIGGDLSLSGEVRAKFYDFNERLDGIAQRGAGSPSGKPAQEWKTEFDMMLDYRTQRTWAAIKLRYDNQMGVRTGTMDKISLDKAYLGGRIVSGDTFTLDAEIGRRKLSNVFDSKVEFRALYDGALLRFNKAFERIGDYYFNVGAFVIDNATDHYGYIAELGMLRIANVGLNMKYSVVDWKKHFPSGKDNYGTKNARYNYIVQQFLTFYQFYPAWIGKRLIKIYGAFQTNLVARPMLTYTSAKLDETDVITISRKIADENGGATGSLGKKNWGWYVGVAIGQVKKQGDWAIEADYQWVQAQAIPEYDFSGIGRGNSKGVGLYTEKDDGAGNPTTQMTAIGACNFRGFEVDLLYAFTDNFTLNQNFKMSDPLNRTIGPSDLHFKQFSMQFIYAF